MSAKQSLAIGVDLGGTEIKLARVDARGTVLSRTTVQTDARISGAHLLEQIVRLIRQTMEEHEGSGKVQAIGLAVPGRSTATPAASS